MSATTAPFSIAPSPDSQVPDGADERAVLRSRVRRAVGFLAPHKKVVAGIVLLALVMAAFSAVEPLILKYIFDGVAKGRVR